VRHRIQAVSALRAGHKTESRPHVAGKTCRRIRLRNPRITYPDVSPKSSQAPKKYEGQQPKLREMILVKVWFWSFCFFSDVGENSATSQSSAMRFAAAQNSETGGTRCPTLFVFIRVICGLFCAFCAFLRLESPHLSCGHLLSSAEKAWLAGSLAPPKRTFQRCVIAAAPTFCCGRRQGVCTL